MKKPTKYYAVEVTWHDAFSCDPWDNLDVHVDIAKRPCVCVSIGWLVYQDKKIMVLAQSLSGGGSRAGASLSVPRSIVKRLRYLNGGKK